MQNIFQSIRRNRRRVRKRTSDTEKHSGEREDRDRQEQGLTNLLRYGKKRPDLSLSQDLVGFPAKAAFRDAPLQNRYKCIICRIYCQMQIAFNSGRFKKIRANAAKQRFYFSIIQRGGRFFLTAHRKRCILLFSQQFKYYRSGKVNHE